MPHQLKIDSGIPISKQHKYPFEKMNVGDSLYTETNIGGLISGAWYFARKNGFQFSTRRQYCGLRLWRVK
jgi:hypothetical protein